jgi:hypothetical protein
MIAKNLFLIIIFIYFFQYVTGRNLEYVIQLLENLKKKNVLMHRPVAKDRPWVRLGFM